MKVVLRKIISEIVSKIIKESYLETISEYLYELEDNLKEKIFNDFVNREKLGYKRIPWRTIPIGMLKITWENFVKYGYVPERFYKNLEKMEQILTANVLKLDILTYLSGHSQHSPDDDFEMFGIVGKDHDKPYTALINVIGSDKQLTMFDYPAYQFLCKLIDDDDDLVEEKRLTNEKELIETLNKWKKQYRIEDIYSDNNFFDKHKEKFLSNYNENVNGYIEDFFDWTVDADGTWIMSDYGLKPLYEFLYELKNAKSPEEKLVAIDKMLNVAHQRSDLASWFVEGGSRALNQLSGLEQSVY